MKKITLLSAFLLCASLSFAQNYVIFLHNMFGEEAGPNGVHPEYGRYEYNGILEKFRKQGLVVISELRPHGTDARQYAVHVEKQVDSLLKQGVPPGHITIVGTSKGGWIAQYVSSGLKNDKINYVFIGSCPASTAEAPDIYYYGNILSISEKSDAYHSCKLMRDRPGAHVGHFKKIELNTGMKHGFLFKALDAWIIPAANWAKQQYD